MTSSAIQVNSLTKTFSQITAVSDLTFTVESGLVTGFLGPNGAGKTTTLSMILGLTRPTSGDSLINGVPYTQLPNPLSTVGAMLEANSFNPGRTGRNHLGIQALSNGIPATRVHEVLDIVGLTDAANRRVGGYSLGMRQRLGIAAALLGDPDVIILDEPINGLDPEGIRWMRSLLRHLASQGKAVLISSHLLTEVQQTVDDLVVVSRGKLVFRGTLDELAGRSERAVMVSAPDSGALHDLLAGAGYPVTQLRRGLRVESATVKEIGELALRGNIPLTHLSQTGTDLEDVFLDLVANSHDTVPTEQHEQPEGGEAHVS